MGFLLVRLSLDKSSSTLFVERNGSPCVYEVSKGNSQREKQFTSYPYPFYEVLGVGGTNTYKMEDLH